MKCHCNPDGWIRFEHQHNYIGLHHGPFGVVWSKRLDGWYKKCRNCNPEVKIALDGMRDVVDSMSRLVSRNSDAPD